MRALQESISNSDVDPVAGPARRLPAMRALQDGRPCGGALGVEPGTETARHEGTARRSRPAALLP